MHRAEIYMHFGKIGSLRKNLPIEFFGLHQLARLVVGDSLAQNGVDRMEGTRFHRAILDIG
jgi:hypothetical protein